MDDKLPSINSFINEIDYLKKRSELLDEILGFYDKETMTFIIPETYKNTYRLSDDKLRALPKTPRHHLALSMVKYLPYSEHERLVNWDKLDEKFKP